MNPRSKLGSDSVRIVLRPLGSPLPMGFFAFAVGVSLTGVENLGWVPPSNAKLIAMVGLIYCLPLEVVGSMVAFAARDAGAATILAIFGMSWGVAGGATLAFGPEAMLPALGVVYWLLGLSCALIATTGLMTKPFFSVLLSLAAIRFGLMGVHEVWHAAEVVQRISGGLGLLLGLTAFYGGTALLLEDGQRHTVLPLFRRAKAQRALDSDLATQIAEIENEAGVRQQL